MGSNFPCFVVLAVPTLRAGSGVLSYGRAAAVGGFEDAANEDDDNGRILRGRHDDFAHMIKMTV